MRWVWRTKIALLAVALLAAGAVRAASVTDFSDQWWIPGESGWGVSVLQQSDVLFVTLFVYGADGKPTWFSAAALRQASAPAGYPQFTGELYQTNGSHYGAPWNPGAMGYRKVGMLTFEAASAERATLTYAVDGVAVAKTLTRTLWRHENLAGSYFGGWAGDLVSCTAPGDDGRFDASATITVTHGADDALTMRVVSPATGDDLLFEGIYRQYGHLARIDAAAEGPSRQATIELFEIEAATSGFTGRFTGSVQTSGGSCRIENGRIGGVRRDPGSPTLRGTVMDGRIANALVCIDLDRNGRCDAGEAQARSDAAGVFELPTATDPRVPLVAEVVAGVSRDVRAPGTTVDASFRMASPSAGYSSNITPFTTLVRLTGRTNLQLAEDLVRIELGLPPKFDLRPATPPPAGSLAHAVARSVVTALQAASQGLDLSDRGALATVVAAFPPELTDLPALRINTRAGVPIESLVVYVDATFELTNPAVSREPVVLNGQIRGRGHSTWGQPKNPYHVKLADDAGLAAVPDILGMTKGRHWALLADWFDRSLIRNKLAYTLGSSSVFADGLKWTPSVQHVEVYLNDDYVGVYLLAETIRIEPGRLDLRVMSRDPAANEVDGGFVVEVEDRLKEGLWDLCYKRGDIDLEHFTPHGIPFCIDRPDEEDITVPQIAYIDAFLDAVELDLYAHRSLARVNPVSTADWYLVNEFLRNPDARFYSSVYMWKDTDSAALPWDRLLNFGPLWDFDRSVGNVEYDENWLPEGCWVSKNYEHNWIAGALDIPDFAGLVRSRWRQKRAALADFTAASIDVLARRLRSAQRRNFERWPILGVQLVNYYSFGTWEEEVGFVKSFLDQRLAWLDRAYASAESFAAMCK